MIAIDKQMIIDELKWHTARPAKVYLLLTDAEKREITRRGFMTKDLWKTVEKRIEEEV